MKTFDWVGLFVLAILAAIGIHALTSPCRCISSTHPSFSVSDGYYAVSSMGSINKGDDLVESINDAIRVVVTKGYTENLVKEFYEIRGGKKYEYKVILYEDLFKQIPVEKR